MVPAENQEVDLSQPLMDELEYQQQFIEENIKIIANLILQSFRRMSHVKTSN